MDFKIDTKDTFAVITPITDTISVNLTEELQATFEKMRQSGSNNFIIDLQECNSIDPDAIEKLVALHEACYALDNSIVYTAMKGSIINELKKSETDLLINIAPKMIEAIDIISMEILERDLFGEEEQES